jgi:hypothetical protein
VPVNRARELLMIGPAILLITFLNLKISKFCERCGRVVTQHFPRSNFCTGCGAPMT